MTRTREKTWLLALLGAVLAIITAIVIWQHHHLIVRPWVIGAVAVPWIALGVTLRLKQDTLGFEGTYVDWWSVPHFVGGVLLGLLGVPLVYAFAIAIVWELVEILAHAREHPANRVVDVALAVAGWATANVLAGGAFPVHSVQ